MTELVKLVPNSRPDAEIAEEFKVEILKAYGPVIEILDRAIKQGFHINVTWGMGPLGKMQLVNLIIAKHF